MEQIDKAVNKALTTLQTNNSCNRQGNLSTLPTSERSKAIIAKYCHFENFCTLVNPDAAVAFARNTEAALMGDYPTLTEVNMAYGASAAEKWLMLQVASLALYTGAKNLDKYQMNSIASVIATEYRHLKVTELLLFFYRFKAGHYGHFYGSVDPMVITCALRDFMDERNDMLSRYEQEQREREREEERRRNPPISYEEYLKLKQQQENEQRDKI
jgi:hypothetical protein